MAIVQKPYVYHLINRGRGKKVFIALGQPIHATEPCVYNSKLNKFNKYWNSQRGKEKDNIVDVEYVGKRSYLEWSSQLMDVLLFGQN